MRMNGCAPPISAADLAHHLGGRKSGASWSCRCPAHDDHDPSLSISESADGKILVHCHAGCSQEAVIDALRSRGRWANGTPHDFTPQEIQAATKQREREIVERIARANRIWKEGLDPAGTIAEAYLTARKLILPPELRVMVLRFHSSCVWEAGTAPCLIAPFRSIADDTITAIHRVRVDQPERWPSTERKMLGPVGGSAIKLDPASDCLCIGEGLETCMAARQLGLKPVWSVGSAAGIENFPPIDGVQELHLLGENDGGRNREAVMRCAERWKQHSVLLAAPRFGFKDFNDALMGRKKCL
jgi:putative DNA primase/helicase